MQSGTATSLSLRMVTADDDFDKLSERLGFPPKVVLLANCNYPTRVAVALLRRNSIRIHEFLFLAQGLDRVDQRSAPGGHSDR